MREGAVIVVVVVVVRGGGGGRLGWNAVGLEDGEDFGFGEVEAEGFHCDFEFVVVDAFVFV